MMNEQSENNELQKYRILSLPETGYYIPNFITPQVELGLLNSVLSFPQPWTNLSHRRLLSLPSQLSGPARDTLIAGQSLPNVLTKPILEQFTALSLFEDSPHASPNHCLVNEYESGQGIMPHEDGPAYYPITATVSLGSHTVLDIYGKTDDGERERDARWRILQEPRSLLVTTGNMYKDTIHGIAEVEIDDRLDEDNIVNWSLLGDPSEYENGTAKRRTRISLTYRDVLKVAKVGGALKFLSKR